jgi:hypothetical protein
MELRKRLQILLFFGYFFNACNAAERHEGCIRSDPSLHFEYEETRNSFGVSKLYGREVVFDPRSVAPNGEVVYKLERGASYFFINNEGYGDQDQITRCVYKENERIYILRHHHTHVSTSSIPHRNEAPVHRISCYTKSPWFFKLDSLPKEDVGIYEFAGDSLRKLGRNFEPTNDRLIPFDGIQEKHALWISDPQGTIDDLIYHVGYNSLIRELNLLPFALNEEQRENLRGALRKRLAPTHGVSFRLRILRFPFYLDNFDFQTFNLDELEMRGNAGALHQLSGEQYEQLGGGNRMHLTFSYQHAPDRDWLWVVNENGRNRTIVVTEKQSNLDAADRSMGFDSNLLVRLCQREVPLVNAKYIRALIFDPATTLNIAGPFPTGLTKDSADSIRLYREAADENNTIYKRLADIYNFDIGIAPSPSNQEIAGFYRNQVPRWFIDNVSTVQIRQNENIPKQDVNIRKIITERINPGTAT